MNPTTEVALTDLINWLRTRTRSGFAQSLVRYYDRNGRLTDNQARAARGMYSEAHPVQAVPEVDCDRDNEPEAYLAARDRAEAEAVIPAPVTPGFYLIDGEVWKAKYSATGNIYAMRRTAEGWEYVRGGVRRLTADHRITPEVAAEHGVRTGICIFCNAELDDADGLGKRVGVGPVCCRKHLGMTQRQLAERLGV